MPIRPRVAVVAAVVTAQVAVPAYVLAQRERPGRFGWHMYAAQTWLPKAEIVARGGDRRRVPLPPFGNARPEIDFYAVLGPELCRRHRDARAVVLSAPRGSRREVTRC